MFLSSNAKSAAASLARPCVISYRARRSNGGSQAAPPSRQRYRGASLTKKAPAKKKFEVTSPADL
jgi:hypothetical protein